MITKITVYPSPASDPEGETYYPGDLVWYMDERPLSAKAIGALLDKYESVGLIDGFRIEGLPCDEPEAILAALTAIYEGDYEDWLGGQEEHGGSDQGGADPVYLRQLRETR